MNTKVIVIDDHPIFRQGLIELIKKDARFEIVGEYGDGLQGYEKIKTLLPDVAVVDISIPSLNGLELAKKIINEKFQTKVVILTMFKDEAYLTEALKTGVKGYVLKENTAQDLLMAIDRVARGKSYISPLVSDFVYQSAVIKEDDSDCALSLRKLSPAEKRVLVLIADNKTSRNIAKELSLSYRTIQNHRNNICKKLYLEGPNTLLAFAINNKKALKGKIC